VRLRHALFAACAALGAIAVGALAIEIGLRVAQARRLSHAERLRRLCMRPARDRQLVYEWGPGPGRCGANSQGFLDDEHALAKAPGTRRVVVVGDSVAEGSGVERDERFTARLAGVLDAEVVTLARGGFGWREELVLFERQVFDYSPDVVVWSYVLNDAEELIYGGDEITRTFYHPRSHLAHLITNAWFLRREGRRLTACPDGTVEVQQHCAHFGEVSGAIARVGELARARGVPVVFVIHPLVQARPSFDDYPARALHGQLRAAAERAGFVVLDGLDVYRGRAPSALMLARRPAGVPDEIHPNALGHELIADALADLLRRTFRK
jgi:lysophospholipase L1-like esterase